MDTIATLVLGTTNAGKLRELTELLTPLGIACCSLAGLDAAVDVEETGDSFAANAALKASQQARALGRWVLAEDSGLVVDALGGAPGIYSARFSGAGATDERNNALLLERLVPLPAAPRSAHYACHAALFIVPEYHRTFGELSPAVKALISHRARAMRAIIPAIERWLRPHQMPAGGQ